MALQVRYFYHFYFVSPRVAGQHVTLITSKVGPMPPGEKQPTMLYNLFSSVYLMFIN